MSNHKKLPPITEVQYDDDLLPEDVLRSLIVLLRHPANSTKAWAELLQSPIEEVSQEEAIEEILKNTEGMLIILEKAKEYIEKRKNAKE